MGLILDTCVVINGERQGDKVSQILRRFWSTHGEIEIGLSVVTVVEIVHGIQRAKDEQRRLRRQAFFDELVRDIPVHPVTLDIARRAGSIEGERATKGVNVGFEDLLIAATAIQLGFGVATANMRHFEAIPGLTVVHS